MHIRFTLLLHFPRRVGATVSPRFRPYHFYRVNFYHRNDRRIRVKATRRRYPISLSRTVHLNLFRSYEFNYVEKCYCSVYSQRNNDDVKIFSSLSFPFVPSIVSTSRSCSSFHPSSTVAVEIKMVHRVANRLYPPRVRAR